MPFIIGEEGQDISNIVHRRKGNFWKWKWKASGAKSICRNRRKVKSSLCVGMSNHMDRNRVGLREISELKHLIRLIVMRWYEYLQHSRSTIHCSREVHRTDQRYSRWLLDQISSPPANNHTTQLTLSKLPKPIKIFYGNFPFTFTYLHRVSSHFSMSSPSSLLHFFPNLSIVRVISKCASSILIPFIGISWITAVKKFQSFSFHSSISSF